MEYYKTKYVIYTTVRQLATPNFRADFCDFLNTILVFITDFTANIVRGQNHHTGHITVYNYNDKHKNRTYYLMVNNVRRNFCSSNSRVLAPAYQKLELTK